MVKSASTIQIDIKEEAMTYLGSIMKVIAQLG